MILYSLLFFLLMQSITVGGLYYIFRPKNNVKLFLSIFTYILFLHSAFFFLFAPLFSSSFIRMVIEYLILYPYFIYMFICMVMTPFFLVAGFFLVLKCIFLMLSSMVSNNRYKEAEETIIPERRLFLKAMTSSVLLPLAGCSVYGAYVGKDRLEITEKELFFKDFPEDMDGFTILQISDIHAGPFMDGYRLSGFVERMNQLSSDIVVVTGDIINGGTSYVDEVIEALSDVRSKKGVFAVLGNHDFYGDEEALCNKLEKSGVKVLRNRFEKVYGEDNSAYFYLAGIDDPRGSWYINEGFPYVRDTLKDIPKDGFKVLLSHRPNVFDLASKESVHLTLAGHTHGGQIILPSISGHGPSLASIAYKYDYGLYQKENSFLYVNKGLGVVGPPVRVNCPREITRIILKRRHR
jgi:predicted MPP superfamily phosphohydrolase